MFLVHGVGSEVWTFLELVKELPAINPSTGCCLRRDSTSRLQSIAEMATTYLSEIEAVVEGGPFVLGGYCSGAVTAFEMASQRRMRGQAVPLLVVFEYWLREEPAGILNLCQEFRLWVADDLLHTSAQNNAWKDPQQVATPETRFRRLMSREVAPDDVRDVLGMWRYADHEVERLGRFMDAIAAYRFMRHDGPIHVFRARTRSLRANHPPPDLGWGQIAQGHSLWRRCQVRTTAVRTALRAFTGKRLDAVVERYANDAAGPSPAQIDLRSQLSRPAAGRPIQLRCGRFSRWIALGRVCHARSRR